MASNAALSVLGRGVKAITCAGLSRRCTDAGSTAARLFYAYADTLLALGRSDDALQWFVHATAADLEGDTDAEERIDELAPD